MSDLSTELNCVQCAGVNIRTVAAISPTRLLPSKQSGYFAAGDTSVGFTAIAIIVLGLLAVPWVVPLFYWYEIPARLRPKPKTLKAMTTEVE